MYRQGWPPFNTLLHVRGGFWLSMFKTTMGGLYHENHDFLHFKPAPFSLKSHLISHFCQKRNGNQNYLSIAISDWNLTNKTFFWQMKVLLLHPLLRKKSYSDLCWSQKKKILHLWKVVIPFCTKYLACRLEIELWPTKNIL